MLLITGTSVSISGDIIQVQAIKNRLEYTAKGSRTESKVRYDISSYYPK